MSKGPVTIRQPGRRRPRRRQRRQASSVNTPAGSPARSRCPHGASQARLADGVVALAQLVTEAIAVETQARIKIGDRDGDGINLLQRGHRHTSSLPHLTDPRRQRWLLLTLRAALSAQERIFHTSSGAVYVCSRSSPRPLRGWSRRWSAGSLGARTDPLWAGVKDAAYGWRGQIGHYVSGLKARTARRWTASPKPWSAASLTPAVRARANLGRGSFRVVHVRVPPHLPGPSQFAFRKLSGICPRVRECTLRSAPWSGT